MNAMLMSLALLAAAADPGRHGPVSDLLDVPITEMVAPVSALGEWMRPILLAVIGVGFVTLLIGIGLCLYRVLRGPHLADRVVASDALTLHLAGIAILLTMALATPLFFDAILIISIIGFASTVAFSQYIHSRLEDERRHAQAQAEADNDPAAEETPA